MALCRNSKSVPPYGKSKFSQIEDLSMQILLTLLHHRRRVEPHIPECSILSHQNVQYPAPGDNILKFRNYQNRMKVPFVLYSDFEALFQKSDTTTGTSTQFVDTHVPSGFCASRCHPSPNIATKSLSSRAVKIPWMPFSTTFS